MSAPKIKFTIPIILENPKPSTLPLFIDNEVILIAELKWKSGTDSITEILLKLSNRKINMFEICCAKMCLNQPVPNHPDYIIMQVSNKIGSPITSDAEVIFNPPFDLGKKKELKLFFNLNPGSCLQDCTQYTCKFNKVTPETKDGVIIVS